MSPHSDRVQEETERLWRHITKFNSEARRSPAIIVILAIAFLVVCVLCIAFSVL
jgi:hypothetical protein